MAKEPKKISVSMKFAISGVSGMAAALLVHPLDLLKNNMQLSNVGTFKKKSMTKTAKKIYQREGIRGLYLGLTAGLLRQVTYGSFRMGTYMWLMDSYKKKHNEQIPGLDTKMLFGCVAGIAGSIVGNPSEVILIRMTGDSRLPLDKRRNYGNVIKAVARITQEEGASALWRGFLSTMSRAIVANTAELSAYSQSKHYLLGTGYFYDDIKTHTICSTFAAFMNLCFSVPFDISKTRIQNMKIVNGVPEFSGMRDVATKVIKTEGVLALWKGFMPSFLCIAPRTVLMFVYIEYLSTVYCRHILKEDVCLASAL